MLNSTVFPKPYTRMHSTRTQELEHLHAAIIPFPLPLTGVHAGNRKAGTRLEQVFRVGRLLNL
jgi:hypothetical protein